MTKYRGVVTLDLGVVVADSQQEAEDKFQNKLYNYAESNDGAELLANAEPSVSLLEEPSNEQ